MTTKVNFEQKEKEDRIAMGIGIFIGVVGAILIMVIIALRVKTTNKKKLKKSLVEEETQRLRSGLL